MPESTYEGKPKYQRQNALNGGGRPPKKENRIRLDPLVHESLRYYVAESRESLTTTPGATIDENTVVSDLARRFLTEKGHFPPRTTTVVADAVAATEKKAEESEEGSDNV